MRRPVTPPYPNYAQVQRELNMEEARIREELVPLSIRLIRVSYFLNFFGPEEDLTLRRNGPAIDREADEAILQVLNAGTRRLQGHLDRILGVGMATMSRINYRIEDLPRVRDFRPPSPPVLPPSPPELPPSPPTLPPFPIDHWETQDLGEEEEVFPPPPSFDQEEVQGHVGELGMPLLAGHDVATQVLPPAGHDVATQVDEQELPELQDVAAALFVEEDEGDVIKAAIVLLLALWAQYLLSIQIN